MIPILTVLLVVLLVVVLFVIVFIRTREIDPETLGVSLNELGYRLVASKPNAEGLCTFKLFDKDGAEIAYTDTPGTLDEAFAMARKFVAEMEEDYVTNNS